MTYRERPAPPALAPWLDCIWERQGAGHPVRVLPDGCTDIVWIEGAGTRIVGVSATAYLFALAPGSRVAGARFRPGAGPALLGTTGRALRDSWIPPEVLWPGQGERLAAGLEASTDKAGYLARLVAELAHRALLPDPLVQHAVRRLGGPGIRIASLAAELGVSERQFRRRVQTGVGYSPKRLARVLRLQRALKLAVTADCLATVAAEAGYADQAHFASECRALTGVAPSVLLSR
ncbi:MAG TPA: helix-turn-helix transcriptional regulator [Streptosporangiaceae bacterium]|nr:helix-turn-helix transcriptional regulator [Streptosporangiaceae bacterium]